MRIIRSRPVPMVAVLLSIGLLPTTPARGDVRINEPQLTVGSPSMAHGPSGALYVAVQDMALQWFYTYKSLDHGTTWSYMTGVVGGPQGYRTGNSSIAAAMDYGSQQWIFVAYESVEPDGTKSVDVLWFDPNDAHNADIVNVQSGISMDDDIHPEICTDSPPYVGNFSVYLTYNRVGGIDRASQVAFARSDDHGRSWTQPQVIATAALETNQRPHIAFGGPMGFPGDAYRVFITYENAVYIGPGWQNDVYVRASRDFGGTWDAPVRLTYSNDDEYDARVASGATTSSALVVYTRNWLNSGDLDIRYAYSLDAGVTWSTDGLLAGSGQVEKTANVCVYYDRRYHCAYWYNFNINYTWAPYDAPAQWSAPVVVNDGQTADPVHSRPAVSVLTDAPLQAEGCLAWTDFRNGQYDAYFDLAPGGPSAVNLPDEKSLDGRLIELGEPYPNPARSGSPVRFPIRLDRGAVVHVDLYDALGRRLAHSDAERFTPGTHTVVWPPDALPAGIYRVRAVTDLGPTAATRSITIVP